MTGLLVYLFVCGVALNIGPLPWLPEYVAMNYDGLGHANNYAHKSTAAWFGFAMNMFMFAVFFGMPLVIDKLPDRLINIPNKTFWLSTERRETTRQQLRQMLHGIGVIVFAEMIAIGLLTLDANLSDPVRLNMPLFWTVLVLFLIVLAAYVLNWIRTWSQTSAPAATR